MSQVREELNRLAFDWDLEGLHEDRDHFQFGSIIADLIFHGDLRFDDYRAFGEDGPFVKKLASWLSNGRTKYQKQTLCLLLKFILFVDNVHLRALYRDAYRRIMVPWLSAGIMTLNDQLAIDYESQLLGLLRKKLLLSITESFSFAEFLAINSLPNLPRPQTLGEKPGKVMHRLPGRLDNFDGALVTEDFVGSGNQAGRVLAELVKHTPEGWPIMFCPLIILESGFHNLRNALVSRHISIQPVLVIPNTFCFSKNEVLGEEHEVKRIRALIRSTKRRVLMRLNGQDVAPKNPFGYRSSGALLVTAHNTPNNTLPMIHHRAPQWEPLFRRISHQSEDGLI